MNFSKTVLTNANKQFSDEESKKDLFDDIEEVCVNVLLDNDILYNMCFIIDEDKDLLTFVATDSEGREKLKTVSKNHVVAVEICYLDELSVEEEDKMDKMVG